MPIYEYRCTRCRRKSSVFVLSYKEPVHHTCPHCASTDLVRVMSRFAVVRSEEDRLESLADPARLGDLDEQDPASMARFVKRMGKELGDEVGEDFDEAVEEALAAEGKDEDGGRNGEDG